MRSWPYIPFAYLCKRTFSSQMNNVELAQTLPWRELEIANTELWAKWKGKTHFSRNEKERFR